MPQDLFCNYIDRANFSNSDNPINFLKASCAWACLKGRGYTPTWRYPNLRRVLNSAKPSPPNRGVLMMHQQVHHLTVWHLLKLGTVLAVLKL